jgi:hypothetical protein
MRWENDCNEDSMICWLIDDGVNLCLQLKIGTLQRFPPRALQGFILPIPNVLR